MVCRTDEKLVAGASETDKKLLDLVQRKADVGPHAKLPHS